MAGKSNSIEIWKVFLAGILPVVIAVWGASSLCEPFGVYCPISEYELYFTDRVENNGGAATFSTPEGDFRATIVKGERLNSNEVTLSIEGLGFDVNNNDIMHVGQVIPAVFGKYEYRFTLTRILIHSETDSMSHVIYQIERKRIYPRRLF